MLLTEALGSLRFFFFQAEDGIRDGRVTGVQTCALPISVGTASAAPNEKATGTLEVPAGVDAATSIPIVVVNGAKPGKILALVSGAHGTEYVSIIAIEKLDRKSVV